MIRIKNKKKYGQHFLNNEEVAVRIVNLLSEKSNIIEIGPGKGVLTKYLLNKKIDNFIVNEIDNDCILYLKEHFPNNLKIIHENVLNIDFSLLFKSKFSIISNLPYSKINKVFDHSTKIAQKGIAYLIGVMNLTPKRIKMLEDRGFGITHMHLCQVTGWFGKSLFFIAEKIYFE